MGRYEDIVAESVERLAIHGWVVGPPLEAAEWRRRLKAAARQRGWRLATGLGSTGYPWAVRTDLTDERGTPGSGSVFARAASSTCIPEG